MNTPEKIAQAYLRLNGFFTIPHFTLLKDDGTHIDLLAVRLGESVENVGVNSDIFPLGIDESFLSKLGVTKDDTIGVMAEVKGGERDSARVDVTKFNSAKSFFGSIPIKKVGFENISRLNITEQDDHIIVSLKYCIEFIKNRFNSVCEIEQQLRRRSLLSKEGSWELSEDFLSDLIYLKKVGVFN